MSDRPDAPLAGRLLGVDIFAERGVLEGHATTRYDPERGMVLVLAGRDATPEQVDRGWVLLHDDGTVT